MKGLKKMKKLLVLVLGFSLIVMNVFAEEGKDAIKKVEIKDLPKEVLDAAKEKVKGFEAKDATVEAEGEGKEYEINGTANGKKVEIEVEVDKTGKVTKVEFEDKKDDKKEEKKEGSK